MHRCLRVVFTSVLVISILTSCCESDREVVVRQPAIWSTAGPGAETPERAADTAVRVLVGVAPLLGDFMWGDIRSGEIEVFSPEDTTPVVRSLLLMRQFGPTDEWAVISAINPAISIDTPLSGSVHSSGPLLVSGTARGFEALVVVDAYLIDEPVIRIDRAITYAGSLETSEPFLVELDLTRTRPGGTVAIVVRGGVGLEDDPGEFSAIPIRIGP